MKVLLIETHSNSRIQAIITVANKKDMPLKKNKWNFDWKHLFSTEGTLIYKIHLESTPNVIEGLFMLTVLNNEMVFMNNLEVSPSNYSSSGKYDRVAGCLIAFACKFSIQHGEGHYKGFLSFESKTELIELYQKKYGAILARGLKMFIDPQNGLKLITKYLNE